MCQVLNKANQMLCFLFSTLPSYYFFWMKALLIHENKNNEISWVDSVHRNILSCYRCSVVLITLRMVSTNHAWVSRILMNAAVKVWFVGVIHGENETVYMSTEFLSDAFMYHPPIYGPGKGE